MAKGCVCALERLPGGDAGQIFPKLDTVSTATQAAGITEIKPPFAEHRATIMETLTPVSPLP